MGFVFLGIWRVKVIFLSAADWVHKWWKGRELISVAGFRPADEYTLDKDKYIYHSSKRQSTMDKNKRTSDTFVNQKLPMCKVREVFCRRHQQERRQEVHRAWFARECSFSGVGV